MKIRYLNLGMAGIIAITLLLKLLHGSLSSSSSLWFLIFSGFLNWGIWYWDFRNDKTTHNHKYTNKVKK